MSSRLFLQRLSRTARNTPARSARVSTHSFAALRNVGSTVAASEPGQTRLARADLDLLALKA